MSLLAVLAITTTLALTTAHCKHYYLTADPVPASQKHDHCTRPNHHLARLSYDDAFAASQYLRQQQCESAWIGEYAGLKMDGMAALDKEPYVVTEDATRELRRVLCEVDGVDGDDGDGWLLNEDLRRRNTNPSSSWSHGTTNNHRNQNIPQFETIAVFGNTPQFTDITVNSGNRHHSHQRRQRTPQFTDIAVGNVPSKKKTRRDTRTDSDSDDDEKQIIYRPRPNNITNNTNTNTKNTKNNTNNNRPARKPKPDEERWDYCGICMTRNPNMTASPECHHRVCATCAPQLNGSCPFCRKPVLEWVKVKAVPVAGEQVQCGKCLKRDGKGWQGSRCDHVSCVGCVGSQYNMCPQCAGGFGQMTAVIAVDPADL